MLLLREELRKEAKALMREIKKSRKQERLDDEADGTETFL